MLGVQRGDRVRRLRDGRFELRGLLGEIDQRRALRRDAAAEILDLALGLEDAARARMAAAGNELRTAEPSPSAVTTGSGVSALSGAS
jgi:hypothetical protein